MAVDHHACASRDATLLERPLDDLGGVGITAVEDLGQASRIVTLVPRSPIIDANSQPIAPPPMTTADPGSFGIEDFVGGHDHRTVDVEAGDERVVEPAARTQPCLAG